MRDKFNWIQVRINNFFKKKKLVTRFVCSLFTKCWRMKFCNVSHWKIKIKIQEEILEKSLRKPPMIFDQWNKERILKRGLKKFLNKRWIHGSYPFLIQRFEEVEYNWRIRFEREVDQEDIAWWPVKGRRMEKEGLKSWNRIKEDVR